MKFVVLTCGFLAVFCLVAGCYANQKVLPTTLWPTIGPYAPSPQFVAVWDPAACNLELVLTIGQMQRRKGEVFDFLGWGTLTCLVMALLWLMHTDNWSY